MRRRPPSFAPDESAPAFRVQWRWSRRTYWASRYPVWRATHDGAYLRYMSSPLADILERIDPEHALVLGWFVDHEGEVGPRPWREGGQSVVPGVDIPIVAQRGIHQPHGWALALSVTATNSSVYLDGRPTAVDDETWVLPYSAHAGGDGAGYASRWNRALLENKRARVPVGVFVPDGRTYRNLGLAMVESYDPGSDTFLLRGPVHSDQGASTWDAWSPDEDTAPLDTLAMEDSNDRVAALVRRRFEQAHFRENLLSAYSEQCAITGCDAPDALQGAHILAYSGRSSQRVENGLLLRADIHLLFDRHLLSVDPGEMRVRLGGRLMDTVYSELHGRPVALPPHRSDTPSKEKLAVHWAVFQRGVA